MFTTGGVNTLGGKPMSWFKRKPHLKSPPQQRPHHTSPATAKALEKAKETAPTKQPTPPAK